MSELKPCPFCGGKATVDKTRQPTWDGDVWIVECVECSSGTAFQQSKRKAVTAWNRRVERVEREEG